MASIKSKNTKPELLVRKALRGREFHYRMHDRKVFGTPDIVIKDKKIAIFIDGCFWHGCKKCYKEPTTNTLFWRTKIENNKKRRIKVRRTLALQDWKVLEFWEHQIIQESKVVAKEISRLF